MKLFTISGFFAVSLISTLAASPLEPTYVSAPVQGEVDPFATAVLQRMSAYISSADTFRFQTLASYDTKVSTGQWVMQTNRGSIAVHRGRGVMAERKGKDEDRAFIYDRKSVTIVDRAAYVYSRVDAPGDLDAAMDFMIDEYGVSWPLADLIYSDPYSVLSEGVTAGTYLGIDDVGGTRCHHIAFRQASIDWELWVETGATPVPRRMRIHYKAVEGVPRFTSEMTDWVFSPHLPPNVFSFAPPQGLEQIEMQPVSKDD